MLPGEAQFPQLVSQSRPDGSTSPRRLRNATFAVADEHPKFDAADAVHLATAILAGADRFITNNSSDFTSAITEIEILTPSGLT
jgi:predicted nucleic acid-binding protein